MFNTKLLCLGILLGWLSPTHADIYTYKDSVGQFYFTDQKMDESYHLISVFRPHLSQKSNENYSIDTYKRNKRAFLPLIKEAAKQYHIDPNLLHALVDTESAFNPDAVSKAGAVGLTQLMPQTAKALRVQNRKDPVQNIHGGARLISKLLAKFNGDKRLALAAYNAGEEAVRKAGNQVPNYPETQRYVAKVLNKYQSLR